jgi:competence protein ComGC
MRNQDSGHRNLILGLSLFGLFIVLLIISVVIVLVRN